MKTHEYTVKRYAIRRGDQWLSYKCQWGPIEKRHLWANKAGLVRALNNVDRVGKEPSEVFDIALKASQTQVVSVNTIVKETEGSSVPFSVRITKFKYKDTWYRKNKSNPDGDMPKYSIKELP